MKVGTEIRNRNKELLKVNSELRKLALKLINKRPDVKTPRDGVALFMMIKGYKTHGSILYLIHKGLTEDAEMLARTLFDTYLTVGLCTKDDSEDMATQYLDFDDVQRSKLFKKVRDGQTFSEVFRERVTNPKPTDENIDDIIKRADEKILKYGKSFDGHWYGNETVTKLSGLLKIDQYYKTAFDLQSHLTHSLPRAMNRYLKIIDDKIVTNHEATSENAGLALVSAFNMFSLVAEAYQKQFKYNVQTEIDNLIIRYRNAVENYEGDL